MSDVGVTHSTKLGLLFRVKARSLWNRTRQAVDEAPVRVSAALVLIGVIWIGLYVLFHMVFEEFQRTPLEATIAVPLVFNFFFMAMLVLLTFSNAIIAYESLLTKTESSYLLTSPLTTLDVVTLKYFEGLMMASWSLILLGLPLMIALAEMAETMTSLSSPGTFYVIFLSFFLAFIPIPASLGLLLAWGAARFFPRRAIRPVAFVAGIGVAVFVVWGLRAFRLGDTAAEVWLRSFLARMSFVESAFLPNNWVSAGIDHAIHNQLSESLLYLGVTVANALFFSWVAVRIVAKHFDVAHDRAVAGREQGLRPAAQASGGFAGMLFFYLPAPLRMIAAKDLRTFFRDPLQWSQLAILFGLMVLYLTNMPTIRLRFSGSSWFLIIPFLNLCAVSLILATFTCRFVFPLVSLEGHQLWLIGLLPMRRGHILLAKFAFAMTVTLIVAVGAMGLATIMLELDRAWAIIHLAVTVAICFGLCGFSVGIGARLPMFDQTNVARIAGGLGGTTNLLASIALVAVVLSGVGVATWRAGDARVGALPDATSLVLCGGAVVLSVGAGAVSMWIGARHFSRVEV